MTVASEIRNDVWTMKLVDGRAKWTKLELKGPPSPRYGFFHGYDPERGRLIVFSGVQGGTEVNAFNDTWLLSVRAEPPTWTRWEKGSPPGRRNGCFVYDAGGQRLLVFGGTKDAKTAEPDLWVFDTRPGEEGWKVWPLPNSPPPRSSGFEFHDPARKRILMGFGNNAELHGDLFPLLC
jgi:hypothetical protein